MSKRGHYPGGHSREYGPTNFKKYREERFKQDLSEHDPETANKNYAENQVAQMDKDVRAKLKQRRAKSAAHRARNRS